MNNSNRTVVDLKKVSYANFYYECFSFGMYHSRHIKPSTYTVNGLEINHDEMCPEVLNTDSLGHTMTIHPRELMVQRAWRRCLLDTWYPVCLLQLSNNHSLKYTGDKATAIWDAWCKQIFNKGKK